MRIFIKADKIEPEKETLVHLERTTWTGGDELALTFNGISVAFIGAYGDEPAFLVQKRVLKDMGFELEVE